MLGPRVPFEVLVSDFDEKLDKASFSGGAAYAAATAREKALAVARGAGASAHLVIGADTVVECAEAGGILEKPAGAAGAQAMLEALSGREHAVHTGVALVLPQRPGGLEEPRNFAASTAVRFAELSPETVKAYVDTGDPMDKAGGYGIQGIAGSFVSGIDGCFYNVVGFPMNAFAVELAKLLDEGALE